METSVSCDTCGKTLPEAEVARSDWAILELDSEQQWEIQLHHCRACVRQDDRQMILGAYRDALFVLDDELHGTRLFREVWRRTHEALSWLYMLDDLHDGQRSTRVQYRQHRIARPGGCNVAGLVWARGKALHTLWKFEATATKGAYPGMEKVDVLREDTTVWAPLETKRNELGAKHYAKHVSGKPLLEPVREALKFLEGLDETY